MQLAFPRRRDYSRLAVFGVMLCSGSCFAGQTMPAGTILRPVIKGRLSASQLRSGSVHRGEFANPVFLRDRELIPAGSAIEFVVKDVKKILRPRRGLFQRAMALAVNGPRPTTAYSVSLQSASLTLAGGSAVPVDLAMITFLNQNRVYAGDGKIRKQRERRATLVLQLRHDVVLPEPTLARALVRDQTAPATVTIPAGARAVTMLANALSGSESREGDRIVARLVQPVIAEGSVAILEGSRLEGRVVRRKAPRRLSRAAALRLNLDRLILPDGSTAEIGTELNSADTDNGTRMDAEGGISAGSTSKKRLAVDLGLAYLSGKLVDDLLEEGIKYALGAGVSGSAAVAARYVGIGTGLFFFAMQKGNDIRLPQYSEIELTFTRPVTLKVHPPR